MNTVSVSDILYNFIPQDIEITVYGWIRTKRDSKAEFSFLNLYDGSCLHTLQVIVTKELHNYKNEILQLTTGCSVMITGKIVKSIGTQQHVELVATQVQILGWIETPNMYPITAKKHTMEYLRNIPHLRPRTHIIGSITRIRNILFQSIHNFMCKKKFIWVPTPIITSSDTEGNSRMFHVSDKSNNKQILSNTTVVPKKTTKSSFFNKEVFLTVSGQLHLEAYACALSKVYTFGPTFRAEYSSTSRHLSEFWMLEPEIAFANLNDIILLAESLLKNIIKTLLEKCPDDIAYCLHHKQNNSIVQLENFINSKFIHIDYTDAITVLMSCKKNFHNSIYWGLDLFSEHERYLSEEYFQSPVVIINHPKNTKAFYMRVNDDNKTVSSMDILIPGIGEIAGGSQREERLTVLNQRLLENNLSKEYYWWYRDLRRYGSVPHAGFGLGFERLISYVTGLFNIKDVVPFPRTYKNISF